MDRVCWWEKNLRGRDHLEFYAYGDNIQRDLTKWDGRVWNRVILLRIKTAVDFCKNRNKLTGFRKMWEIP
jgi:hypothetical protein